MAQINDCGTYPATTAVSRLNGTERLSFVRASGDADGLNSSTRAAALEGRGPRQSSMKIQGARQTVDVRANRTRPTGPGVAVSQIHDSDIPPVAIIAVLGPTGVGKSSFIRAIAATDGSGAEVAEDVPIVGHGLRSCTNKIQPVRATIDGRDCVLIDTPGYDDTTRSDAEILRETATFLEEIFHAGFRLTGVVYLHRITDNRLGGSGAKNLRMFEAICGLHAMPNVVICSTMWDMLEDQSVGEARERELCAGFWTRMIDAGAQVRRLDGSRESAVGALRALIPRLPVTLRLQDELVRERVKLSDTTAGKEVGNELARAMEAHQEEIERLQRELRGAQDRDIDSIREEIEREHRELRARENETRHLHEQRERELRDLDHCIAALENRRGPVDLLINIAKLVAALTRGLLPRLALGGLGAGGWVR